MESIKYQRIGQYCTIDTRRITAVQSRFRTDGSHMDPLVGFQPERWLSSDTCPTSEYIPFGAGPRYCLGADLSLAEMKVFLAVMARTLESFELMQQSSDNLSTTIQWKTSSLFQIPADGVKVSVQPRI